MPDRREWKSVAASVQPSNSVSEGGLHCVEDAHFTGMQDDEDRARDGGGECFAQSLDNAWELDESSDSDVIGKCPHGSDNML